MSRISRFRSRVGPMMLLGSVLMSACGVDAGVTAIGGEQTPTRIVDDTTDATDATTIPTGDGDDDATTPATPETVPPVAVVPEIVEPELFADVDIADVIDLGGDKPDRLHDPFVAVAFTDIERWWSDVFPAVYGAPFEPLDGGVYAGYPERSSDIPGCGEPVTAYEDLQLFVAFYCEFGDFMAYDDGDDEAASLLTPLAEQFGSAVMGVVLAHEYGHAIQQRTGALEERFATIITEQQADCFAGAWTGQAYRGESPLLRLGDVDVRAGLLAMLSVRDPAGVDQFVPGGHGSAFDRVGAFQEGFVSGPARCAELLDDPLDLMPNEFQSQADAFFEGNAPYDCTTLDPAIVGQDYIDACTPAPEFLADDLNDFWATAVGTDFEPVTAVPVGSLDTVVCDGATPLSPEVTICPTDRALFYDEPVLLADYEEFGDFSLGYFYGIGWAEFAQRDIGSSLTGEDRALLNDCLTGAWVRDITPDRFGNTPRQGDRDGDGVDDTVESSPGDLDEAIRMAIKVGDLGANVDVVGSAFEKIESFRAGVLGGLDACTAGL